MIFPAHTINTKRSCVFSQERSYIRKNVSLILLSYDFVFIIGVVK